MSPTRSLAVAIAAAAIVVVAAVLVSFPLQENSPTVAQEGDGAITIITISGGSLLAGASYSITPDPRGGSGAYAVQDGGEGDANPAAGMIEIRQVNAGNYTVAQSEAPAGYGQDRPPRIVEVKGDGAATATFSNAVAGAASPQPKSILYTAKFECGTISGSEGPLRPGHYDTDIGILNKQDFEVRLTWNAVLKDGRSTNSILKALEPQAATGIVCDDIRKLVGGEKFAEGFFIIAVPLDAGHQGALAGGSTVVGRQSMDL
ncbi:MAG: SpaA isopeptide-forming pilin-related protein, partial [Nitrososphaera sp.]